MSILKDTPDKDFLIRLNTAAATMGAVVFPAGAYVRELLLGRQRSKVSVIVAGDSVPFIQHLLDSTGANKSDSGDENDTPALQYDKHLLKVFGGAEITENTGDVQALATVLAQKSFSINAMALDIRPAGFGALIDPFQGEKDLENRIIRTTLAPDDAFQKSPISMLAAVYLAAKLNFRIEQATFQSIRDNVELLKTVPRENVTGYFKRLILLKKPSVGLDLLKKSGISQIIFPELDAMTGVEQRNEYLHKDVFYHTLKVLDNISEHTDSFELRMAALMHDIAKPQTKRFVNGLGWTFHGHEELGARMVMRIARRMKLPIASAEYISKLVRLHMRPSQLVGDAVTDSAVRRLITEADEDINDLMTLCRADITSKNPHKVRKYLSNFDKVESRMKDVEALDRQRAFQPAITGNDIMTHLGVPPGPMIGKIKKAITDAIHAGIIPNEKEACFQYFLEIKERFPGENGEN